MQFNNRIAQHDKQNESNSNMLSSRIRVKTIHTTISDSAQQDKE